MSKFDRLEEKLDKISEDLRIVKSRLVSIESWLAALSKDKNLSKSHTFAKNIEDLSERISPTVEVVKDTAGEIEYIQATNGIVFQRIG